ncbi:hypothetical protein B0H12DRAFT_1139793 [Mycena haematopus]|nr:hypothetical protein B0H12DRAFT_1139793 [Mycena haematopus]
MASLLFTRQNQPDETYLDRVLPHSVCHVLRYLGSAVLYRESSRSAQFADPIPPDRNSLRGDTGTQCQSCIRLGGSDMEGTSSSGRVQFPLYTNHLSFRVSRPCSSPSTIIIYEAAGALQRNLYLYRLFIYDAASEYNFPDMIHLPGPPPRLVRSTYVVFVQSPAQRSPTPTSLPTPMFYQYCSSTY